MGTHKSNTLNKADKEWIKKNSEFGEFGGVPYVAVPNMPGREPFTIDEIVKALKDGKEKESKK